MPVWRALADALRSEAGIIARTDDMPRPVGGGDISAAWKLETASGPVFLKTGSLDTSAVLSGEADGLSELASANAVRVPAVLAQGVVDSDSYLALEWLDLGRASADSERMLGTQLAALHRRVAGAHGWFRDNTIGLTPQVNTESKDWVEFYRDRRLRYQLELAARNGFRGSLEASGAELLDALPDLLHGHEPAPSLLHGDLWGGNHGAVDGEPVIFDPAVYYGDRETDLAMTRLFGGYGHAFYDAYEEAWPLSPGHEQRLPLYQLYHVLNHLNLFGAGYLGRAESIISGLLT